jgi:hypothetical protein
MRFFLSYASDSDKESAAEIKKGLEELDTSNPHQVFVDYESLKKAQDTDARINRLLEECDALLYLVTVSSIRSFWCGKEVGYAQCLGKPIVPIAGPGITGEYIKSQSVPWISGLKWVNWWEKDRARKIVEALEEERGILTLLLPPDGFEQPKESIVVGIRNTREFSLTDVSVGIELRIGNQNGTRVFAQRSRNLFLHLHPGEVLQSSLPLSEFQRPSATLSLKWLLDSLRARTSRLDDSYAIVLVKYCIGGQHYVSSIFHRPLIDVFCPHIRKGLLEADRGSSPAPVSRTGLAT